MKRLEELAMNALPSLQTILYDGWILRFADGYTSRANSINPIYHSSEAIAAKIEKCAALYQARNLQPIYKISPDISPENLDQLLAARNYQKFHPTSLQNLNLNHLKAPVLQSIVTHYDFNEVWFTHYARFNQINEANQAIARKMLHNLIPQRFFTSLLLENEIIACGMGVLEAGYLGLFNITVAQEHRHHGYGRELMLNMLQLGQAHGAKNAYLQVMLENHAALKLYQKLGFTEAYQYHYRISTS